MSDALPTQYSMTNCTDACVRTSTTMSYPTRLLFEKTVLVSNNVHVVKAFDKAHLLDDIIPFLSYIDSVYTTLHICTHFN
jgi:hypothetical protein